MKKIFLSLIMLSVVLCLASCSGGADVPKDDPEVSEDVNPDSIKVESVLGLNEQIYLNLAKGEYVISYKKADAEEYTVLDKELMLENKEKLDCYILGLAKGLYDVKIEQGEGDSYACKTITDIDVEKQDRSGYAHFQRDEGIGGYNNDGTVKEGAKILYVNNENKNTVALDINGTTYTGMVAILQAKEHMEEPLIIRVLDKITTNQWVPTSVSPGLSDYSSVPDGYYESIFSNQQGENLAGLPVWIDIGETDTRNKFITAPDGIVFTEAVALSPIMGNAITGCMMNLFEVYNAENITIEGVGTKAEFFQFGIAFEYCKSIEVKNITFSKYPVDALSIKAADKLTEYGWVWIHNNTFKEGYSSFWHRIDDSDYKGEYNSGGYGDANADESIDLRDVRNLTFSYNKFYKTGKTVILGGWEYDAQLNLTFHHNFYLLCEQRLPLSRNSNIHNYNNYYADCNRGLSPRTSTYVFSEANYFDGVSGAYYFSDDETKGAVKSFGDIYRNTGGVDDTVVKVTDREAIVENDCKGDWVTDHSKFDTDPELFYYDAENKRSDVEILHEAKDVPDFVPKYAGAGILERMDFPTDAE